MNLIEQAKERITTLLTDAAAAAIQAGEFRVDELGMYKTYGMGQEETQGR